MPTPSRLQQFRVTKFDPAKRDPSGRFSDQEEWIHVGQLGKTVHVDGVERVFTTEDFLATEERYVRAVERFFAASSLPHVRATMVTTPENDPFSGTVAGNEALDDPSLRSLELTEDQKLGAGELAAIVRMNLRDFGGCRLEVAGRFFAHFGWDMYMYLGLGSAMDAGEAIVATEADGLFVERVPSPYQCPEEVTPEIRIEVFGREDGLAVEGMDHLVTGLSLPATRRMFGFSDEHPFTGFFEITPQVGELLAGPTGFEFDFDHFSYQLSTNEPWY